MKEEEEKQNMPKKILQKNTKTTKKKQWQTHKMEEIKKEGDNFPKEAGNVNRGNCVA
jgi:hypothetical protein